LGAHAKPRSREAAKRNAQFRCVAGEPRTGVRGCMAWLLAWRAAAKSVCIAPAAVLFSLARAFQPEHCAVASVRLGNSAGCIVSREAAKGNAEGRCVAGEPRTGVRGCGAWLLFWRAAAAGRARATATQRSRGAETVCCSKSHEVRSDVKRVAGGIAGAVGQCDCGITAGAVLRAGGWGDLIPAAV
jgi:hypothetical protein